MKIRKSIIKTLALVTLIGSFATSAYASSEKVSNAEKVSGGWIEGVGKFTNDVVQNSLSPSSTDYPDWTKSYTEANPDNFTTKRCVGETGWQGMYHYTRAQLTWLGSVRLDSGRIWDNDYTYAATDWGLNEFSARTYWGN